MIAVNMEAVDDSVSTPLLSDDPGMCNSLFFMYNI